MASEVLADGSVVYSIELSDQSLPINDLIGKTLSISYLGQINCTHCGRKTNKSFSQGYCFPCMKSLAQCDQCIMSPEKCHYHLGTCREPEWGEKNCMTEHVVYLANTTAPKVGITRASQVPTRWVDQGAEQALPIFRVSTRQQAGLMEDIIRQHVADKTNWRNMLKGDAETLDLVQLKKQLLSQTEQDRHKLAEQFSADDFVEASDDEQQVLKFPVEEYLTKISSFNLDKNPKAGGVLKGIKGQYLIFDSGVINLRKYTGYLLEIEAH